MDTIRMAGCDLGKANAKFVVATLDTDGRLAIEATQVVPHHGQPHQAFCEWYHRLDLHRCAALAATGLHAEDFTAPVLSGLPEEACLEAALRFRSDIRGPVNLVSIGARGYAALSRDAAGHCTYVENDKCSSGTGETMVRIAARFGLSVEEADALALSASEGIAITARCSVFAKSEMTHFGNQGRPADRLLRGYFDSVARHVAALLRRIQVPGPVLVIGGVSRLAAFVRALQEALEGDVRTDPQSMFMEALGACRIAAELEGASNRQPLPENPNALLKAAQRRYRVLAPARNWTSRVTQLDTFPPGDPLPPTSTMLRRSPPPTPPPSRGRVREGGLSAGLLAGRESISAEAAPFLLGLDLGSTGSKAVLTRMDTGDPVIDVYDRTRGNPVEAAQRLVATLLHPPSQASPSRGEASQDLPSPSASGPNDSSTRRPRSGAEGATGEGQGGGECSPHAQQYPPDVRAIGVTGSGREAVATVLRAAYPEAADRILVMNEIVAHATAAVRCDARHGEDLTVVEIGGQDAKFIRIVEGQIIESDMNKACSAGTGSFLEEQGNLYGVSDIEEFGRLAAEAARPPDLGQMCTVFVAEAAAEARTQGFELPDLFAGFMYSVVHNYLHRVMGQRTFGRTIFFQGKPASSAALAWTLAAVTGRDVVVPPNPGAMGAWGIALCARNEIGMETLQAAGSLDSRRFLDAQISSSSEFQCKDPKCETLCRIEKSVVAVSGAERTVFSGGSCPKFEVSRQAKPKLPLEAPSAFDARDALLAPFLERAESRSQIPPHPPLKKGGEGGFLRTEGIRSIGVPLAGANTQYIPWIVTLLREMGLDPRVLRSDGRSLRRGEERCVSYDACAPAKLAHGIADTDVDTIFFPKILSIGDRDGPGGVGIASSFFSPAAERSGGGGAVCPMEQALPEMVGRSLHARGRKVDLIRPRLDLRKGLLHAGVLRSIMTAARRFRVSPARALRAASRAARAQQQYEAALAAIGESTLSYARSNGRPVVVLCGSLHVIHEREINAGIAGILRQNGVLPVPMDCFVVPPEIDPLSKVAWGDANRALRVALACRARGDAYPLLLSSFGCGPASFSEHIFSELMAGYPHTALETDGHGGTAGYVTRVQSFLHTVRNHDRSPAPLGIEKLQFLQHDPPRAMKGESDTRFVVFSMADHFSSIMAATYRSFGVDAVAAGPNSAETFARGRGDCSGKECIPYQLIWGAFRSHLDRHPPQQPTVLLEVFGEGMCRNCMFVVKDKIALRRLGLEARVTARSVHPQAELGRAFLSKLWLGVVAWDVLNQLAGYYRAIDVCAGNAALSASPLMVRQAHHERKITAHPEPFDKLRASWGPELAEGLVEGWCGIGNAKINNDSESGELDRLYKTLCKRLEALLENRGTGRGTRGLLRLALEDIDRLLREASSAFAEFAARSASNGNGRTVLVTGDVYTRLDDFGGDDLIRKLNRRGLRVIIEPAATVAEYMVHQRSPELMNLPTGLVGTLLMKRAMAWSRRRLYGIVRERHPWLPATGAADIIRASRALLDRNPVGEAPITIGSALHAWKSGHCDGVVVSSPWGCGPALIGESLLRHEREIPMLFLYHDGLPMDDRRLNAFAYRLRSRPARAPAAAPA